MRNLTRLTLVAVLVLAVAAPVAAGHGSPIEGRWLNRDVADGSLQMMTITEFGEEGFFNVVYTDTRATGACDPPARFVATSSTALWSDIDGRFFLPLGLGTCSGRSSPTIGPITIEFDPGGIEDPENNPDLFPDEWDGTLVDEFGNTWFHVGR